ncbi:D-TA family PLP-dependent enzyme [uncultured Fibrella sp.]|uniref:D-TA family PLP-dependent enzyme n=1 Tax=uncultured Fibrella sp. TaxID=1284596 RepID=UPI0035C97402
MSTSNWYTVQNADDVDSPSLLIYPDRVKKNIQTAIRLAGGVDRLRPHVKTHKMAAVTQLMLAAGIYQFKCATIAEAEMLAQASAPDVLLAYPVVGPKMTRLFALTTTYPATHFACLIDNLETARQLSNVFAANPLAVYIDLNIGMGRTGISPTAAVQLAADCASLPGIRLMGLHGYDGHIRDTDVPTRTSHADVGYALASNARQAIENARQKPLTLIMGGTPTSTIHAERKGERVQTSPGTFVFWDAGYAALLPDLPYEIAAVLITRVISVIDESTLTLDLGHKSVAAENPQPRVLFFEHPDVQLIGQSEEHLVVNVPNARQHLPGEVWYGVPKHICPTVALYESVKVVTDGLVTDTWPVTARARQLTI